MFNARPWVHSCAILESFLHGEILIVVHVSRRLVDGTSGGGEVAEHFGVSRLVDGVLGSGELAGQKDSLNVGAAYGRPSSSTREVHPSFFYS